MATSAVGELAVWSDTNATEIDRSSGTGRVRLASGVYSVMDPATTLFLDDDFMSASTTTINFGQLGWTQAGGTATFVAGEAEHPGILRRECDTTGGTIAYMSLRGTPTTGLFLPAEDFDMTWIMRQVMNTSNTVFRFGLTSDPNSLSATHGIYIEKKAADTEWFGCCRATNSENRSDALATCDTNFHRFRIWRSDASTISFSIDGAAAETETATIPTAALMPFAHVSNNSQNEDHQFDIDYFSLLITGLSR